MLIKKVKIGVVFLLVAIGVGVIIFSFKYKGGDIGSSFKPSELLNKIRKKPLVLKNEVVVQVDESLQKINVDTGEKLELSELEKKDFSGFSGLPKSGEGKDVELGAVIPSLDKSQVIVTFSEYSSALDLSSEKTGVVFRRVEFTCNVSQKKCEPSELLSQTYQGLEIKDKESVIHWSKWNPDKNLLLGYLVRQDVLNISPVYVCNTKEKTCQKTEGFDSTKPGDINLYIPEGTFSPSLEKFVMLNQHDSAGIETGRKWEILLYTINDLAKPVHTYDISAAINRDDAYDSVYSVAWSQDEKKIAIGTATRIFIFDLENSSLSLAYVAPMDEEGNSGWNSEAVFLSPDGKYVVFADEVIDVDAAAEIEGGSGEEVDEEDLEPGEEGVYVVGVLKKIDLGNNNSMSELLRGYDLSLELQ